MDPRIQLSTFVSSPSFKFHHPDVQSRIAWVDMHDGPDFVLVLSYCEFVGWVRITDDGSVWRFGSLREEKWSAPILIGELNRDEGQTVIDEILYGIQQVAPQWLQTDIDEGAPERLIRTIEGGVALYEPLAASTTATVEDRQFHSPPTNHRVSHRPPITDYSLHAWERYPAAAGFTERDLNGVPLITVHPAVIPAVFGAIFAFFAVIGGAYELYVVVRWVVPAMAIWTAVVASSLKKPLWVACFTAIAILFNPVVPIYSTREFWLPVDVTVLVLFCTAAVKLRASKPAPKSKGNV